MSKPSNPKKNEEVSSVLMVSLLFLVHTFTNSLFLSPLGGDVRCLFWDKETCSQDEAWIVTWFAFSHFHVALLLSGFAYASNGDPKLETTLTYMVACILFVYMAEGISSISLLNAHLANVQVVIFVLLLLSIAFFTAEQERNMPRFPLPRKLTTSSFDRRKKIPIATFAIGAQFLGSMFRAIDMVLGGGHTGYLGDMSSPVYQSIASMGMGDMMVVAGILGGALRFLEPDQQKILLWFQVVALLMSQAMLAGEPGAMIDEDQKQAGGIGNFISLVTATIGAL